MNFDFLDEAMIDGPPNRAKSQDGTVQFHELPTIPDPPPDLATPASGTEASRTIPHERGVWLERASDLLAEPDAGPTPFLVDQLLVDRCLGATQGAPKIGKTWVVLECGIAIATGRPAFGRFEIPQTGPVIVILEEAGRAALHRRLDALARGNAIDREELAGFHFAANRRIRLDDPGWQNDIVDAAKEIKPRAVLFDPLARLKASTRDENSQTEFAPMLEFLRDLRDEADAAVIFVHHTGHGGDHLRGTSDLESWWESKLTIKKTTDGSSIAAEHREAEAAPMVTFAQAWDHTTRSLRLVATRTLAQKVADYLIEHPDASANVIDDAIGGHRADVLKVVKEQRAEGGTRPGNHPGTTPFEAPIPGGSDSPPLYVMRGRGNRSRGAWFQRSSTTPPISPRSNGWPRRAAN